MKIKVTLFIFAAIFMFVSNFGLVSAVSTDSPATYQSGVEGDNGPAVYQSGVEGVSSTEGDSPSTYQSGVEGDNSSDNGGPSTYQSGVEGENGPGEVIVPVKKSSSRSGSKRRVPVGNLSSGEVLGASTDADSCKLITTFMKIGQVNNSEEVKMVQKFLNTEMNSSLPVTGFFGALTFQIVKDFQVKYKTEVLKPWVDLGLMDTQEVGTGYLYKTTQYKINTMLCPDADIVYPVLN